MFTVRLLVLLFCLALPMEGASQTISQLKKGDVVRVRSAEAKGTFSVVDVRHEGLMLQRELRGGRRTLAPVLVPMSSIEKIHLGHPRNSEGARARAAGRGVLIGAGVGIVVGLAAGDDEAGWYRMTAGEKAVGAGVLLGAGFGLLGLLLGGDNPGLDWEELGPANGIRLAAGRGGAIGISLERRF